jgi:hypothetical protein
MKSTTLLGLTAINTFAHQFVPEAVIDYKAIDIIVFI